jgi:DNA-binding beta-propeller fold protein YncE
MVRVGLLSLVVVGLGSIGCGGGSGSTGTGGSGAGATGVTGTGGTGEVGGGGATGGTTAGTGGTGPLLPPGAFTLVTPLEGSSAQPLTPDLQWNAADGATSYIVEVATTSAFGASDLLSQSLGATTTDFTVPDGTLSAGIIYYWRVTAANDGGATAATGAPQWFSSPYLVRGAHGVAVTPDGSELVVASDVNNGPIDIVALATGEITSVGTGIASQPMGVAVSPDGSTALVTLLTNGNGGINGLAVVDLTNNTVPGAISDPCVGTTLSDVAYFPSGAYAAIPDLSSGCGAMGLNTFAPSVGTSSFSFVNFNDTNDPSGVAVSPDGTFALVTVELDDKLYRVTFPNSVSHLSLSSTSSGVAITPDGTTAVVAEATVDVIDLASGTITPIALTNGDAPNSDFHDVAITPDGTKAVIVATASIQTVSLDSNAVVAVYPATGGTSIAISPDGSTAFVTDRGDGWVRVVPLP